MKSLRVIGIGLAATMVSAAAWLGCSSDDSTPPADAGPDATGSSSSSGGGSSSSSGAGSSSGGGSSSSSGAGDSGRDATLDAGTDAATATDAPPGTDASDAAPVTDAGDASLVTWQQVYGDIISQRCIGCHAPPVGDAAPRGGFAFGHLDMGTVDAGYLNLINQPPQGTATPIATDAAVCNTLSVDAGSDSGLLRVTPGNPGLSLLYHKVNGYVTPPPCGAPMPPTAGASTEIPDGGQAAAVLEIQQWISQGANP